MGINCFYQVLKIQRPHSRQTTAPLHCRALEHNSNPKNATKSQLLRPPQASGLDPTEVLPEQGGSLDRGGLGLGFRHELTGVSEAALLLA